jgi:hypothetical protein
VILDPTGNVVPESNAAVLTEVEPTTTPPSTVMVAMSGEISFHPADIAAVLTL